MAKPNPYQQVAERDGGQCQVCGLVGDTEIHHIIFRSHGGPDEPWNLVSLCRFHHREAHSDPITWPKWAFHGAIQHGMSVHSYGMSLQMAKQGTWRYREVLATCVSCKFRTEANDCEVWDQKVDWDYGCNAWECRF